MNAAVDISRLAAQPLGRLVLELESEEQLHTGFAQGLTVLWRALRPLAVYPCDTLRGVALGYPQAAKRDYFPALPTCKSKYSTCGKVSLTTKPVSSSASSMPVVPVARDMDRGSCGLAVDHRRSAAVLFGKADRYISLTCPPMKLRNMQSVT